MGPDSEAGLRHTSRWGSSPYPCDTSPTRRRSTGSSGPRRAVPDLATGAQHARHGAKGKRLARTRRAQMASRAVWA